MILPLLLVVAGATALAGCLGKTEEPIEHASPQGSDDLVVRRGRKELFGGEVETTEVCEGTEGGQAACEPVDGDVQRLLKGAEATLRNSLLAARIHVGGGAQPFIRFVTQEHQECRRKTGYVRYAPEDSYTCIDTVTVVQRSARLCFGNTDGAYCSGPLSQGLAAALDRVDTELYLRRHPEALPLFRGAGLR